MIPATYTWPRDDLGREVAADPLVDAALAGFRETRVVCGTTSTGEQRAVVVETWPWERIVYGDGPYPS